MPQSSIDITSPQAGTTQPLVFVANVSYDNQSGVPAWVRVTCSFMSGSSGGHTVTSTAPVGAGPGTFDASVPHTSGQTGVSVSARLTQSDNGTGELYAADSHGDVTIADAAPIRITRGGGFGSTFAIYVDPADKKAKSTLRLTANGALVLAGTFVKTMGDMVGVVICGGKKKRPHTIYEARDGEVVVDTTVTPATWTATIPAKALQGGHPRGALVILYDADRKYVASDSVGLRD